MGWLTANTKKPNTTNKQDSASYTRPNNSNTSSKLNHIYLILFALFLLGGFYLFFSNLDKIPILKELLFGCRVTDGVPSGPPWMILQVT